MIGLKMPAVPDWLEDVGFWLGLLVLGLLGVVLFVGVVLLWVVVLGAVVGGFLGGIIGGAYVAFQALAALFTGVM